MSHVTTTPHMLAAAAGDLASVGSTIYAANANAAAGTAGVHAPGGDAVSAFVSALFAAHAQAYQAAGAQANAFHNQFVQALRESAGTYANAEAANASPLEKMAGAVSASAGHLNGNGAGAAQHGGMATPVPGGVSSAPSGGNPAGGGVGPSGADAHPAAAGAPQGGNAGIGANGDGGAPPGAPTGGAVAEAGGVGAAAVAPAWGQVAPAVPAGPAMPHLATAPAAPPVVAGDYPAAAGLAPPGAFLSGDSAAIGGLPEPATPVASAVAATPAAPPPIPTAPRGEPLHHGNPAHPGDAAHPDTDHDKAAVPLPLLRLRVPGGLRGFFRNARSGLRDKEEWREELREAAKSKPWGREELLGALGLRPPGNA
jgi:hypothetical protein